MGEAVVDARRLAKLLAKWARRSVGFGGGLYRSTSLCTCLLRLFCNLAKYFLAGGLPSPFI